MKWLYFVRQLWLCTLKCKNLWQWRVSHQWQDGASVIMSTLLSSLLAFGPFQLLSLLSSSPPRWVLSAPLILEACILVICLFFQNLCTSTAVIFTSLWGSQKICARKRWMHVCRLMSFRRCWWVLHVSIVFFPTFPSLFSAPIFALLLHFFISWLTKINLPPHCSPTVRLSFSTSVVRAKYTTPSRRLSSLGGKTFAGGYQLHCWELRNCGGGGAFSC